MTRHGAEPFEEIALIGGRLYLDVMGVLVTGFFAMGCVRGPTGACDRVLVDTNHRPDFSATSVEFGCGNFEASAPPPIPRGGGFVTIWTHDGIAWQGREEDIPERFLQQDLDL